MVELNIDHIVGKLGLDVTQHRVITRTVISTKLNFLILILKIAVVKVGYSGRAVDGVDRV